MIAVDDDPGLKADLNGTDLGWEPRVLVVDDDEVSLIAATGLLQSLGFTVDAAGDGREALEMIGRWPYVAIFMDCEMPEVDGYTAARHLRAREGQTYHTPVIAMTGRSRSVSVACGMDHHLAKPLEIDMLRVGCRQLALLRRDGVSPSWSVELLGLDKPLLDPTIFLKTAADRARLASGAATFISDAVARLPELWRSINAGDAPSLQRLSHTLRDRAIAVGTRRVADLCDRLGQTSVDGTTTLAAEFEPQLRGVLSDTGAAIRAYVDGVPSPDGSAVQLASPSGLNIAAPQSVEPVRIALADDDPLARVAIRAMLERADWLELVGVAAGVEGIVGLATVTRPDVVLLDWMMPGGGGREAARRILDRSPGTLIVALTSSDSLAALAEMTSAGASCMVAKGGSADQLTETIARALKASAAARAAEKNKRSGRRGIAGGMSPHGASSGNSPLDEAGMHRLRSEFGSTGVLADLVDLFGSQTPGRLSDMRRANEAADAAAVSAGAHQLKGGCLTLAAVHMAELCDGLEASAGNGSLEGAATLIDQIESEFERAHAALTAIASRPTI